MNDKKTMADQSNTNVKCNSINEPTTSYVICIIPRTGSTLLCQGLTDTKLAGTPKEHFNSSVEDIYYNNGVFKNFNHYLKLTVSKNTTPNGVFGFKANYHQFRTWFTAKKIKTAFRNLHFIYIKRQDHVRQAISYLKAKKTQRWTSTANSIKKPKFSYKALRLLIIKIEKDEERWEAFFQKNNIAPLRIFYEDFVKSYGETIIQILKHLKITIPENFRVEPPTLKKQADQTTEDWLRRYTKILSEDDHDNAKRIKSDYSIERWFTEKITYSSLAVSLRRRFLASKPYQQLSSLIRRIIKFILSTRGITPYNELFK